MKDKNSPSRRILVVDDDIALRSMIINFLEENGMCALSASGQREMARHFAKGEPSLVVLDLPLGQEDGLDLLREIRSRSDVPVIIVSGQKCDDADRIIGLELGADDYLNKPFGLRELLARIRAVLRRRGIATAAHRLDHRHGRCRFCGWQLDRRARRLTDPDEVPISLTNREYALLVAFLDAPRQPLSREHLLKATRMHFDVFDRSIDVQISRLRRKLESTPSAPRVIQTERGVGYVFTPEVEPL